MQADCQSELIFISLTNHEYEEICELASARGMSASEYLHSSALTEKSLITGLAELVFELGELHSVLDDSNVRTTIKEVQQEAQAALNTMKEKLASAKVTHAKTDCQIVR